MDNSACGPKKTKARLAQLMRQKEDTHRFQSVWEDLREAGIVKDWEGGTTTDEDILWDARRSLRQYNRGREGRSYGPGQDNRQKQSEQMTTRIIVELTRREKLTTDALRAYFAAHAAKRSIVKRYRKEYLPDGKLLTRDEDIEEYLSQKLAAPPNIDAYCSYLIHKQVDLP